MFSSVLHVPSATVVDSLQDLNCSMCEQSPFRTLCNEHLTLLLFCISELWHSLCFCSCIQPWLQGTGNTASQLLIFILFLICGVWAALPVCAVMPIVCTHFCSYSEIFWTCCDVVVSLKSGCFLSSTSIVPKKCNLTRSTISYEKCYWLWQDL